MDWVSPFKARSPPVQSTRRRRDLIAPAAAPGGAERTVGGKNMAADLVSQDEITPQIGPLAHQSAN
jgi:hypothetical protein